jgi:hypothetical protein
MNSVEPRREPFQLSWRQEIVVFFSLFSTITAYNALSELHKTGHPIVALLSRSLVPAAIISIVLQVYDGVRTR